MKKLMYLFALLCISSCTIVDDSCEQEIVGTYVGTHSCSIASSKTVTVTISGTDGDYTINIDPPVGLLTDEFEQDGCEFSYDVGSFGNKKSAELSVSGTTLTYSKSGDSFGALPCRFTGEKQ
ncbi:MAG: hypothetical protein P1U56_06080 [Saprospiraceae bacterium]|nr:hypothetical protein [Saprospiraceae bacterium]